MAHASLIATLLDSPSPDGADLAALPDAVEWLEVRGDRVGDIDPEWLRSHFKGRLLYALRSEVAKALNHIESQRPAAKVPCGMTAAAAKSATPRTKNAQASGP